MTHSFSDFLDWLMAVEMDYDEFAGRDRYTIPELIRMATHATDMLEVTWDCFSCGVDTFALGEDYAVHNELWRTYGVEGVLCIGCLEMRLGRKLGPGDFPEGFAARDNRSEHFPNYCRSERLNDRLGWVDGR